MSRNLARELAGVGVLAALYFGVGKLGLALATVNPSASPVWAPTGLALAGLLILGYRAWPGVMLGAFLVNITTTGDFPSSLAISAGNTGEALIGAYLLTRFAGGRRVFALFPILGRRLAPFEERLERRGERSLRDHRRRDMEP